MYDVQRAASSATAINSGNTYTVIDVTVPTGRIAVSGGSDQFRTNGNSPRAQLVAMFPVDAVTWRFAFWNSSGSTDTVTCYVNHVPESETVEVLRVKP